MSSHSHVYVQGDVTIDPSAVISSGVILRANPESKISIAASVCIGAGSILHADQGTLEIEIGVNLGTGVLVVGHGKIGANACIGPLTTIYNASIERLTVVPAGSVVGNVGRQVAEVSPPATPPVDRSNPPEAANPEPEAIASDPSSSAEQSEQQEVNPDVDSEVSSSESPPDEEPESADSPEGNSIYGQGSVDRILKTLFPYNH
ncbi:transferase [Coleofasciculus sp. C1-SOL-03]|uniref:transferase n=1 Tax=Coleofasciculus sp. C1-SOL-03 TaxID=3069522 RepID=UPI004063B762